MLKLLSEITADTPISARSLRCNAVDVALILLLLLAILYNVYWFAAGIDNPLLDLFSFRQAQTAVSSYWLDTNGLSVIYETPVLGYPWTIPFEFPIYQWLGVLIARLGLPLDVAGRTVAFSFHLAVLIPLTALLQGLRVSMRTIMIVCILFLVSPLYVFWGRTVMIEPSALFFAVSWLALLSSFILFGGFVRFLGAVLCGSLAALVKLTTFPAFGLLGAALFVVASAKEWKHESRFNLPRLFLVAAAGVLPVAIAAVWVAHTDEVRIQNFLGSRLTSRALISWNFGPLEMRLTGAVWRDAMFMRMLPEVLGYCAVLSLVAFGAWLDRRKYGALVFASIAGFLIALLIFTNLHLVHNYYQYANAIFVLVALGLVIGALAENGRPKLAAFILIAVVGGQVWYFFNNYAAFVTTDLRVDPTYKIAKLVRKHTARDEALLVFGLDWSSVVPYYSRRKSLAVPNFATDAQIKRILARPGDFLGGLSLGAIVLCNSNELGKRAPEIEAFVAGREEIGSAGPCRAFSAAVR